MSIRDHFLRQPQSLWLRKALFQVHLWTGLGAGLYIVVISLSGSAIVFRREIARLAWTSPRVAITGRMLTRDEIAAAARKAYPRFEVVQVALPRKPDRAAEVLLARGQRRRERAFNPYTGQDLGEIGTDEPKLMSWLVQLHDDLLGGQTGRLVNGAGAIVLTVLSLTGLFIWWPGLSRWKRSLIVRRGVGWARFTWDLHSAIGFWLFLFVLMWGVSGIYLAFPQPFTDLLDYLQPFDPSSRQPRAGDEFLAWLARVHFGRAYGTSVKWLYTVLGLAPAVLFATGAVMWWNRVLRPWRRRAPSHTAAATGYQPSGLAADDRWRA